MPSGYEFWDYLCNYCLPQHLLLKMNDMHSTDWCEWWNNIHYLVEFHCAGKQERRWGLESSHMIYCPHADWACLLSAEPNHRWAISTVWPTLQEAEERRVDYRLSLSLYSLMELRVTFLSGSLPVSCDLRRWRTGEIGQIFEYHVTSRLRWLF